MTLVSEHEVTLNTGQYESIGDTSDNDAIDEDESDTETDDEDAWERAGQVTTRC